jgi:hypothetical protein
MNSYVKLLPEADLPGSKVWLDSRTRTVEGEEVLHKQICIIVIERDGMFYTLTNNSRMIR